MKLKVLEEIVDLTKSIIRDISEPDKVCICAKRIQFLAEKEALAKEDYKRYLGSVLDPRD
ncbi:hypothetical protein Amet_4377 [Alkaliphilus metalliredigens QYMF]|uniref:Uncharacterized protein n=1 Tax=Alkaliphilus metalliredigens (strain QYMF) TaxID=293826 RepID=A6TKB5_ALKMQ|nr:hypothetical protein [Alkaliphilus metalliredigens]ABR46633.1 hypothetical protein Amet_0405 [Alkaliphilus metalliredigens QYMF]ABR50451.1 hypothetical protein Amet_4377 [Alkaliphilus metalliredigens QYMF]